MTDVNHPGSSLTASVELVYNTPTGIPQHPGSSLTAAVELVYDVPTGIPQHPGSALTAEAQIDHTPHPPRMETQAGATITITVGASMSMFVEPLDPPDGVDVDTQILSPGDIEIEFDRYGRPL